MTNFKTALPSLDSNREMLIPRLIDRIYELKSMNVCVQAQPIGMMRLALNNQENNENGLFVHFWLPHLPIQDEAGPFAHTHVFHLKSRIISGTIKDTTYFPPIPDPNGPYQLIKGKCVKNFCVLTKAVENACLEIHDVKTLQEDDAYEVKKGVFHLTSLDGPAITLMEKSNIENSDPILAIPRHLPITKKNFDRTLLNQEIAWRKIMTMLDELLAFNYIN